jgi:hypothetical protein
VRLEARCEGLQAAVDFQLGRRQDARTHASRMLQMARKAVDPISEAEALQTLGALAQHAGALEQADELLLMALDAWNALKDPITPMVPAWRP